MKPPIIGDSISVEMASGLNEKLEGFVQIRCEGEANGATVLLLGQLPPQNVREMALQWLEIAEAAEQDQIVARELVEGLGLPQNAALGFISSLRERRTS